jgi:hypothetical protein
MWSELLIREVIFTLYEELPRFVFGHAPLLFYPVVGHSVVVMLMPKVGVWLSLYFVGTTGYFVLGPA